MSPRPLRSLALLACLPLLLAGCLAFQANQKIVGPAVDADWPAIQLYAIDGGVNEAQLSAFDLALSTRDPMGIVGTWPAVEQAAQKGIDAHLSSGVIGAHAANLQREHLARFNANVHRIAPFPTE